MQQHYATTTTTLCNNNILEQTQNSKWERMLHRSIGDRNSVYVLHARRMMRRERDPDILHALIPNPRKLDNSQMSFDPFDPFAS